MDQPSTIFKAFITCAILFLWLTVISAELQIQSRIVNGRNISIEEVPFMVQILKNQKFFCGGVRVSPRHILTAAHCLKGFDKERFTIVGAASKLSDYGIRSTISKVILHPDYNKQRFDSDVAILVLRKPLKGPIFKLPRVCQLPINTGDEIELFGWGKTFEYGAYSNQLQTVKVSVVSHSQCQNTYPEIVVTKNMFCAESPGKDACRADSGGPALLRGQLCGIISVGKGCARRGFPGIYVNLNNMLDFLVPNLKL